MTNTITLAQKDADFILGYLRADLQKTNEQLDFVNKKEEEIFSIYNNNENYKNNQFLQLIMDGVKLKRLEYDTFHKKKIENLVKCIELLTIGSEIE